MNALRSVLRRLEVGLKRRLFSAIAQWPGFCGDLIRGGSHFRRRIFSGRGGYRDLAGEAQAVRLSRRHTGARLSRGSGGLAREDTSRALSNRAEDSRPGMDRA